MPIPPRILDLVNNFREHEEAYKRGNYNETEVRRQFVDEFFVELGWDVRNKQSHAEAYKEVVHEDRVKVVNKTKAPDYSFRVGGIRKFFVEAKKPAVKIHSERDPAFQLRRYGWSAGLPLSILTDFEEFAIYDCRVKPKPNDKASTARIFYCRYTDYEKKWDEISDIFSKEAILKGAFDKFVASDKKKRGTATVDVDFLKAIEGWRDVLARNLALRNNLNQRELNFAVTKIIDRLIFLRITEDRGIENFGQLKKAAGSQNAYADLLKIFQAADDRYNSGLFHFRAEKDVSDLSDTLTPKLKLDDKILKEIVSELYYPKSSYEFSVMPADILGKVYEQFLGKVIRLTSEHRAVVEEKPEVKKAGGVYYTPKYIVDYIVQQTVGKLCEKAKTPAKIVKLKIVDPACGSGSFLLGAYQFLIDWHREYFARNPKKFKKEIYQSENGEYRLTTTKKKEILLNNIFGVDIDGQAVEVTKLSLLLKVLENESDETLQQQFPLFRRERVLPSLANNIKCGNSLIGSDFYAQQELNLFGEDERLKINAFDWEGEFPKIFTAQTKKDEQPFLVTWVTHNSRVSERMVEYGVQRGEPFVLSEADRTFVLRSLNEKIREEGLRVLALNVLGDHVHLVVVCEQSDLPEIVRKLKGYSSFALGRQLKLSAAEKGRQHKVWARGSSHTYLDSDEHFANAIQYTMKNHIKHNLPALNSALQRAALTSTDAAFDSELVGGFDAVIGNPPWVSLKGKFGNDICSPKEIEYFRVKFSGDTYRPNLYEYFVKQAVRITKVGGLQSFIVPDRLGLNEQFKDCRLELLNSGNFQSLLYKAEFPGITADTLVYVFSPDKPDNRHFVEIGEFRKPLMKIKQSEFKNFQDFQFLPITPIIRKIYFKLENTLPLGTVIKSKVGFIAKPKQITEKRQSVLQIEVLKGRNIGRYRINGNFFFEFNKKNLAGGTQDKNKLSVKEKILLRKTGYPLLSSIDFSGRYPEQSLYFLFNPSEKISLKYLQGIMNSKLFQYVYWNWMITNRDATPQLKKIHLDKFPVRVIDFSNPTEKSQHDKLVKLVDQMLDLNKKLQTAKLPQDQEIIQRQITATDREIDNLVFDLYGLGAEERRVVLGC